MSAQTRLYCISAGRDFLNSKVDVKRLTAEAVIKRLRRFHVTQMTRLEYGALSRREKAAVKKQSGFFIGGDGAGLKTRDSWLLSSVATLDLDDLTSERAQATIEAIKALGAHAAIYSTASHSPEKPRLRAVIFLSTDVFHDDYSHLIERLSTRLPEGAVSSESLRPTQVMYLPQRCSDGEEFFLELPGKPLDPAPFLAEARKVQKDPERPDNLKPAWDKPGIVGEVARRYGEDLDAAIEELGIENVPYERASVGPTCGIGEARYTRVGASGADGAIWYPDDGHMFSHHGASDPGAGKPQTIFDIVRLTRFKDRDKDMAPGTPVGSRPSDKAATIWFRERFPEMGSRYAEEEFDDLDAEKATSTDTAVEPSAEKKAAAVSDPPKSLRFRPIPVDEFCDGPEPQWVIEGVIPEKGIVAAYSPSGTGKSFTVLNMGLSIARGIQWHERDVKQGKVVYIAGESPGGFRKRLRAYIKHHDIVLPDLKPSFSLIGNMPDLRKMKDLSELIEWLRTLGPLAFIVIDTLARATPGANENAGEDMGRALAHCQEIGKATGATVCLIHHTGKDEARGMRGWSGIRAHIDTEIEITELVGKHRLATVSKQRDGEDGLKFAYELIDVPYGIDAKGRKLSSLVVKPENVKPAAARPKADPIKSPYQIEVLKAVRAAGGSLHSRDVFRQVKSKLMRDPDAPRDDRTQFVNGAVNALVVKGLVVLKNDIISLAGTMTNEEFDALEVDPVPAAVPAPKKSAPPVEPKKPKQTEKIKPAKPVAARKPENRKPEAETPAAPEPEPPNDLYEIVKEANAAADAAIAAKSNGKDHDWNDIPADAAPNLMKQLGIPLVLADALVHRGFPTPEKIAAAPKNRLSENLSVATRVQQLARDYLARKKLEECHAST
jgi:hypothetical protein